MTVGEDSRKRAQPAWSRSARLPEVAARRASLITRIHGRYYDVGGFDHPGGCHAIECARDRDATELFESYHALHRARPLKTLEQFEVSGLDADRPDRFLAVKRFGESGFDWAAT